MIKENAILRLLLLRHRKGNTELLNESLDMAIEALRQPERKAGRWIDEGFYADGRGAHAFRCSECGGHIIEYDADPFCKWCGAKMEEVSE